MWMCGRRFGGREGRREMVDSRWDVMGVMCDAVGVDGETEMEV